MGEATKWVRGSLPFRQLRAYPDLREAVHPSPASLHPQEERKLNLGLQGKAEVVGGVGRVQISAEGHGDCEGGTCTIPFYFFFPHGLPSH